MALLPPRARHTLATASCTIALETRPEFRALERVILNARRQFHNRIGLTFCWVSVMSVTFHLIGRESNTRSVNQQAWGRQNRDAESSRHRAFSRMEG